MCVDVSVGIFMHAYVGVSGHVHVALHLCTVQRHELYYWYDISLKRNHTVQTVKTGYQKRMYILIQIVFSCHLVS